MLFENYDFDMALYQYADHLVADYNKIGSAQTDGSHLAIVREGKYQVSFERGRKFLKVVHTSWGSRSVHSFICIKAHDGWKYGDILKAASWKQPAKNFARGNVLDTESYKNHRWTGA